MTSFSSDVDLHAFDGCESYGNIEEPSLEKTAPSFSLPSLHKARTVLIHALDVESDSLDANFTVSSLEKVAEVSAKALRLPAKARKLIYDSLYGFLSKKIDKEALRAVSLRLSGNLDILRSGKVIPEWKDLSVPVWSPVSVTGCDEFYGVFPGKKLEVMVLGGIPAGSILEQCVSNKFIQFMLREIGYPKFGKYHPMEVLNTRFTCNLMDRRGRMRMVAFAVSSSQRTHNRQLCFLRHGHCPLRYPWECPNCLEGGQSCPAALHVSKYVKGMCENGHAGILAGENMICNACIEKGRKDEVWQLIERNRNGNADKVHEDKA